MSKKQTFIVLLALLFPLYASATGIGLYAVGNSNTAEVTHSYAVGADTTNTWEESMSGVGLALGSNFGKDKLFGYQFNLEYLNGHVDSIDGNSISSNNVNYMTLNRINMLHTFGFGFVRTQMLRVWAGPRINLSYQTQEYENISFSAYEFGVGIAPALGINVNFNKMLALSFDADYRFGATSGAWYEGVLTKDWYDMSSSERGFSARLYVVLKFNESFR